MNEILTQTPEKDLEGLYLDLLEKEPKVVYNFVPTNAVEQRSAFLNNEIENPDHVYNRLDSISVNELRSSISQISSEILSHNDLPEKHKSLYVQFVERYEKTVGLLQSALLFNNSVSNAEKTLAKESYMQYNAELYGLPDESTYKSLLYEKINRIKDKLFGPKATILKDEFLDEIGYDPDYVVPERFRPTNETVEWMHDVAEGLYGGFLSHVPESQEEFRPEDVKNIFNEIIESEFGEAASEWQVSLEEATSINVRAAEKTVIIPDNEVIRSHSQVRKLVVHELGVHLLRSIMGEETDVSPLRNGLSGYYDSEEGLGVVMEQALENKIADRGVDHYLTAGLAYFNEKDFRGAFEVKWKMALLQQIPEGQDVNEEQVNKARYAAYNQTRRVFRGTDELPLFKDLSYYNGADKIWRHLEEIRGDDIRFMFLLLGKQDPTNEDHKRVVYEARTI